MELKDLRKKDNKDLQKLLVEKNEELRKVVSEIYQAKEKNTQKPKFLRKDIARIKTVINQENTRKVENSKGETKDE